MAFTTKSRLPFVPAGPQGKRLMSRASPETLGLVLGVFAVVLFGATLPFTRVAVMEIDPWFVTTGRAALAGSVAGAVLLVLRRPLPPRELLLPLAVIAVTLTFGFSALMALAMQTASSAHGGVVIGVLPLATGVAGAFVAGERPSAAFWFWGAIGAALVVAFTLQGTTGRMSAADGLLLLAVASAAIGYAISGRLARTMPGWEVISWAVTMALPVNLVAALVLLPEEPGAISPAAWGSFAYLGLVSQYLGFFAWNAAMAMGGVSRVSQTQLLQPFVTLAIAAVLLGETVDAVTVGFACAVIVVVALGRRAPVARAALPAG